MTRTARINPSILNCDFMRIGEELDRIATADAVHVDVMDDHFVPNLTFGTDMVAQIVQRAGIPIDAHLMIADADRTAPAYAEAGAASVTFHAEAAAAPIRLARELRSKGAKAGIALRPATGVEPLLDVLGEFDMLLIMTVEPGFGGQSFLESMLPKIRRARAAVSAEDLSLSIQVDGGVSRETIERCAEAGADVFVAGSAIYKAPDAAAEIDALRTLAAAHVHTRYARAVTFVTCSGVGGNPSRRS
ncbi:ribulose-phosphate 3-epimerase [Brachybacterium sp. JHP9]|uniref:Ribulose-phosphate 3-epimerase n=2 Tax=Brachybacterium equifaecis TaxID=2910770 RepID=A0ABT0R3P9_9MICO|nr:ribulose-phosphate 3-epimerase [Brachybacterium equifaecis]MCL6424113.1 ribulose-phosphate 3-epimerase [Brachybacterium equifaecis]